VLLESRRSSHCEASSSAHPVAAAAGNEQQTGLMAVEAALEHVVEVGIDAGMDMIDAGQLCYRCSCTISFFGAVTLPLSLCCSCIAAGQCYRSILLLMFDSLISAWFAACAMVVQILSMARVEEHQQDAFIIHLLGCQVLHASHICRV